MSEALVQINEYLDLFFAYGPIWVYLAIFVACFIENIVPPFPGDSFIVAAGGLVAVSRLDPVISLLVCIAGGMTSVTIVYLVGRRRGREYFLRKNFKFFSVKDIEAVEARFERHGSILLIASRFAVGLRVLLALAAGIGEYSFSRMIVYTTVSYFLFAGLLMYLGYKLVENLHRIEYYILTYNYIVWPIVVGFALFWVWKKIRRMRKDRTG